MLPVILGAAVIVATLNGLRDLSNTLAYPGVDLRGNVAGARVLLAGGDPYFVDSARTIPAYSITVTPPFLSLYAPLVAVRYPHTRRLYLFVQWGAFLGSLALLARGALSAERHRAAWVLGLALLSSAHFWALHVERGQKYIILVLLIAVAYRLAMGGYWLPAGAVIGFAAMLRPGVAVFCALAILLRQWRFLAGALYGVLAAGVVSVAVSGAASIWVSYARAMRAHTLMQLGMRPWYVGLLPGEEPYGPAQMADIPSEDSSIVRIWYLLSGARLSQELLAGLFILGALVVAVWVHRCYRHPFRAEDLFLLGGAALMATDFFLPAGRWSYADVLWMVPLIIGVSRAAGRSSSRTPAMAWAAGGLLLAIDFEWLPHHILYSELCMAGCVASLVVHAVRE